jgi:hypothetical protein
MPMPYAHLAIIAGDNGERMALGTTQALAPAALGILLLPGRW